jgi:uncharacterized OB-fold protein
MWEKPLPQIDLDTKPLFEGYKDHEFVLFRCQDCGDWYFPKTLCKNHDNDAYFGNIDTEPASGRGTVYAWATTRRLFHGGFEDDLPYTFAMVELEEGPLFGTQIVDPIDVEIGQPVEVEFRDVPMDEIPDEKQERVPFDDGFTLPYFTPVAEGDA